MIAVASSYLRGYLAVWTQRKRDQNPTLDWAGLKAMMRQEFVDSAASRRAQDQLLRIRQREDETVTRYVQRVRRLVVVSGVDCDSELIIRTFTNGIRNPLIRANVAVCKPDSFEIALFHATECASAVQTGESHTRADRKPRMAWRAGRIRTPSNGSKTDATQYQNRRGGEYVPKRAKQEREPDNRRCFNCRERGHLAAVCPRNQSSTNNVTDDHEKTPEEQSGNDWDW